MQWWNQLPRLVRGIVLAVGLLVVSPVVAGCSSGPVHWLMAHQTVPTAPIKTPAPAPAQVPEQISIGCDSTESSSYQGASDCTTHDMYSGDVMAFFVHGVTPRIAAWLCQHNFQGKWKFSRGTGTTTLSMCKLVKSGTWQAGDLETGYDNPQKLGAVTVTWQITGPAGYSDQTSYTLQVLQTAYQGVSPPGASS